MASNSHMNTILTPTEQIELCPDTSLLVASMSVHKFSTIWVKRSLAVALELVLLKAVSSAERVSDPSWSHRLKS